MNIKTIFKTSIFTISMFAFTIFYSSCRKTTVTPPNPNDEELITTMQINFTDSAGMQMPVSAIYRDIDGDGGNAPIQWDSIKLKANTTYFATILLLDETKTPIDTISNEVIDEAQDHLFCFTPNGIHTNVIRTDKDQNNLEIGLQTKWITNAQSTGSVQIVLRHQPNIKNGSCALGASDLDITFATFIQ